VHLHHAHRAAAVGAVAQRRGHHFLHQLRGDLQRVPAQAHGRGAGVGFHADCVQAVARAAERLGYSHMPTVSGAGHDAIYAAQLAPAGMIFIPCKDGISHNEIEDAKPEHITAGANVLLQVMLERAGV
jgi:acetylornithine deacetylase/succinyl-diaminopimelate desuccinylase-like protein